MNIASVLNKLGCMYKKGRGVAQDYAEAVRLFRLAVAKGHAGAQYNLGLMFEKGRGVAQDDAEAVRLYRLATEQGHGKAEYRLAIMLSQEDRDKGVIFVQLLRNTAKKWNKYASYELGYIYDMGQLVEQNYAEARRWYCLAAHKGHARAQSRLGYLWDVGLGGDEDEGTAKEWYTKAAEKGDIPGQFCLGNMLLQQYPESAMFWFHKAAKRGDMLSQYHLGRGYEYGKGVTLNLAEAAKWYRLATDQGYDEAKIQLKMLEAKMLGA